MVRVERRDRVEIITLDRPERRNAVDHATLAQLLECQETIAEAGPDRVRAVVLTGAPPAFSAGADLTGVEQGEFARDLHRVLRGFGQLPVPVIAAVDGPALGAGSQLVVAADLRIATASSVFGIPAAKLGLAVDHWTIRRLTGEFTAPIARAMLIAAEVYSGEQLHRIGGVHRLGDLGAAVEWAMELAELAPLTIAAHKLGIEHSGVRPESVLEFEQAFDRAWSSDDVREGRAAFLDKRPARFSGR